MLHRPCSLHKSLLTDLNKAYWSANVHYSWFHNKTKCLPLRNAKHAAPWCTKRWTQMLRRFCRVFSFVKCILRFCLELISCLFSFVSSSLCLWFPRLLTLITPTCSLFTTYLSKFQSSETQVFFSCLLYYLFRKIYKEIWIWNIKALFEIVRLAALLLRSVKILKILYCRLCIINVISFL